MEQQYLIAKNFRSWYNGKTNTLEKANYFANILFNKDYNELYSYQQNYIIKRLARTLKRF